MKEIGNKIKSFTNIYFKEYNSPAFKKRRAKYLEHEKFACDLLDKVVENLSAVGELLILSQNKNMGFLQNSTYLLLRSGLSDCIILMWMFEPQNGLTDDEGIKIRAEEMLRDHIKHHVSLMQKMQTIGLLPASEKKFEIEVINNVYGHLLPEPLKNDLSIKKMKSAPSISSMLGTHNANNPAMVEAYNSYFIFSKIEHPGAFTRMMLEKAYTNEPNPMNQYVESSIFAISSIVKIYLSVFFKNRSFLKKMKEFKILES